jgi:hypothetical protein
MTVTVRLRVVGVFYDKILTLDEPADPTVRDVLDFAEKTSNGLFRYRAEVRFSDGKKKRVLSLTSFQHELEKELFPSLGKQKRQEGIYEIKETVDTVNENEIVHAWQYYVISADRKNISNAVDGEGRYDVSVADPEHPAFTDTDGRKPEAGFTPFDEQKVKDGAEIVWRNVSIARGPTRRKPKTTAKM